MNEETDIQVNARHKQALRNLFLGNGYSFAAEMKLREEQRLEWVEITAERHKAENAAEREAEKERAATRLPKGTAVMNTLTGVRGIVASIGKHDYKVVRPGGTYVKAPHENWEAIQ